MAEKQRKQIAPAAVFINCPFDPSYRKVFDAIVFAVCALGFEPRCALDQDNGIEERLAKILRLIKNCQFGIHDLSYMKVDPGTKLPRHNMPFELGLFMGFEFAGPQQPKKSCLILDRQRWRYRKSRILAAGIFVGIRASPPLQSMRCGIGW
jgi:hypothetical protein